MELIIDIIINPLKLNNLCFLCFKQDVNTFNVYEDFVEIWNQKESYSISTADVFLEMFPGHEIILNKICKYCSSVLMKMYILLQTNRRYTKQLNHILTDIENELTEVENNKNYNGTCKLRINEKGIGNTLNPMKEPINIKEKNNFKIDIREKCENDSVNNQKVLKITKGSDCEICRMNFGSQSEKNRHKRLAHAKSNTSLLCFICGKSFRTRVSLKTHINGHRTVQCKYCFKELKNHANYRRHIKRHETGIKQRQRIKKYNCMSCNYQSTNNKCLEAHVNRVHLQCRPYVCQVCPKSFYKKSHLNEHAFTHTTKRLQIICDHCGATFTNKSSLTNHIKLHTNEKPYKCTDCHMAYVSQSRLSEHYTRKHGEKNLCHICGRGFGSKKDLRRHLVLVHADGIDAS